MDKQGKLEYNFLKRVVIMNSTKDKWNLEDIEYLYKEFQFFLTKSNIEEISILRKGEVFLGKYCDIEECSYISCKDMIFKIINSDELAIPIQIAIIGALLKLCIEKDNVNQEME